MDDFKVVFIHGNGSMRWSFGWALWLKNELDKLGVKNIFETFPDSILARKEYWLPFLKDYLNVDRNTLLVGWSSGAVAAMRYAEKNKIFGSVLVAPCYTDLGLESEKVSGWFNDVWNWNKIKGNQGEISLIYSKNDEFIPLEEFLHIQNNLRPELIYEFEDKGHFINENKFEEVLDCIKRMLYMD